jgi:hypothetical protein
MPALNRKALMKLKGRRLDSEDYELFLEALRESGYVNTNGATNQLANYLDYKAYLNFEEYEDSEGHKIYLEVIEEVTNGERRYHIKDIEMS